MKNEIDFKYKLEYLLLDLFATSKRRFNRFNEETALKIQRKSRELNKTEFFRLFNFWNRIKFQYWYGSC